MSNGGLEESQGALDRLFEVLERQSQQIENVLQNQAEMKVV